MSTSPERHPPAEPEVSEDTPLLLDPEATDGSTPTTAASNSHVSNYHGEPDNTLPHSGKSVDDKPFPYNQILVLCYASIVEPVAFFIIFPYINEMVERIGQQRPENVGFWTGTIESLFSLVQMLLIIFYGRVADRLGRKPVLVFSLAGIAVASALFGMSATLWQMVVFRCMAGLFAGSSVTIRAMLSENCTKATQAKAFGWFMFARYYAPLRFWRFVTQIFANQRYRNLGIFIGPAIGKYLMWTNDHTVLS